MFGDLKLFINNSFYENEEKKPFQSIRGKTPYKYNKIRKKRKIAKASRKKNRK